MYPLDAAIAATKSLPNEKSLVTCISLISPDRAATNSASLDALDVLGKIARVLVALYPKSLSESDK